MRKWLACLTALTWAGAALAQAPGAVTPPACPPSSGDCGGALVAALDCVQDDDHGGRLWGGAEYLLWWIKDGPLRIPLVATGNPQDPFPGALGQPGTRIVFGGQGLDYGALSGGRATLGAWIDCDRTWGVEGSGFLLERGSTSFRAGSDAVGNPPIYLPAFRSELGREGSFIIGDPLRVLAGNLAIDSTSRLWGAEGNAYLNFSRRSGLSLDLLTGVRYLDLEERLTLAAPLNDPILDIQQTFGDSFATRTQFYGGQVGARACMQRGALSAELTAKVALGENHQVVDVLGATALSGSGTPPGFFPGGIFAQPSNMGRRTHDEFAVVPEVQIKAGYDVRPGLRVTVGYDFLYWNKVVRPGNQIDHAVNQTQSLGGPLVGPATPVPLFNRSDFWAQGVSAGLEIHF
jgi:hypothetical protein